MKTTKRGKFHESSVVNSPDFLQREVWHVSSDFYGATMDDFLYHFYFIFQIKTLSYAGFFLFVCLCLCSVIMVSASLFHLVFVFVMLKLIILCDVLCCLSTIGLLVSIVDILLKESHAYLIIVAPRYFSFLRHPFSG